MFCDFQFRWFIHILAQYHDPNIVWLMFYQALLGCYSYFLLRTHTLKNADLIDAVLLKRKLIHYLTNFLLGFRVTIARGDVVSMKLQSKFE